ncbi:MAG: hypothetical protein ACR2RA_02000 [Geminicoccaceae bacterium]
MQIDWIKVIAQLVNFLVLIWLLKRFLYGPITKGIERREARIAGRMQQAEDAKREAEIQAEALAEQRAALDRRQDKMMDEARHQAKTLRDLLEREAREEVETLRIAWRRQVEDERKAFLDSVRLSTAHYVGGLAREVLLAFADADLEIEAAKRFAEHLRTLDDESREELAAAAQSMEAPALIESSFELSAPAKTQLTRTLHEVIAEDMDVDYRQRSDLLLGLRLRICGRTVAWNFAEYLDRLEAHIDEALRHGGPTEHRHVA